MDKKKTVTTAQNFVIKPKKFLKFGQNKCTLRCGQTDVWDENYIAKKKDGKPASNIWLAKMFQ